MKLPVTMSATPAGAAEAHRSGCADLRRGAHRRRGTQGEPCSIGEHETRESVADDWFGDMIGEGSGTAAEYAAEIHFAPCLSQLA